MNQICFKSNLIVISNELNSKYNKQIATYWMVQFFLVKTILILQMYLLYDSV